MIAQKRGEARPATPLPATKSLHRTPHLTGTVPAAATRSDQPLRTGPPRRCKSFTAAMQAHQETPSRDSATLLITAYKRFAEQIAPDHALGMVAEVRVKLIAQGTLDA